MEVLIHTVQLEYSDFFFSSYISKVISTLFFCRNFGITFHDYGF